MVFELWDADGELVNVYLARNSLMAMDEADAHPEMQLSCTRFTLNGDGNSYDMSGQTGVMV